MRNRSRGRPSSAGAPTGSSRGSSLRRIADTSMSHGSWFPSSSILSRRRRVPVVRRRRARFARRPGEPCGTCSRGIPSGGCARSRAAGCGGRSGGESPAGAFELTGGACADSLTFLIGGIPAPASTRASHQFHPRLGRHEDVDESAQTLIEAKHAVGLRVDPDKSAHTAIDREIDAVKRSSASVWLSRLNLDDSSPVRVEDA